MNHNFIIINACVTGSSLILNGSALESNIFRKQLPNMRLYKRLLSIEPTSCFYFLITDCQTPFKTMVSKPNDGYFHPKSKQNNYVTNFYMDCQLDIISG